MYQDITEASCISILLYGCGSYILRAVLIDKLEIFARTWYRIKLGVKHDRENVTNESLYHLTGQRLSESAILCSQVTVFAFRQKNLPKLCHLWIQDPVISWTRSSKDDISQSDFVQYSTWQKNVRSQWNKKDDDKKILMEPTFCCFLEEKAFRPIFTARMMMMKIKTGFDIINIFKL